MNETARYACGIGGGCVLGAAVMFAATAQFGWGRETWVGVSQFVVALFAFAGLGLVELLEGRR